MCAPPGEYAVINGNKEKLLWYKYVFFKNGIPPDVFDKTKMSDILAMVGVSDALKSQEARVAEINRIRSESGII